MSRRALVIANWAARDGDDQQDAMVRALREHDIDVLLASPSKSESLAQLVSTHQEDVEMIILAGGDGTLNAAAEALVEAQLPVGIIPLGTANDLARTLELPTDPVEACRLIAAGRTRRIDLGQVNDKYFFNVASIGLGVVVSRRLTSVAKSRWGPLAYVKTALRTALRTRPFRAEIRAGGRVFRVKTVQIAVGNGRHYGGGMTVGQDATIDDHLLDLYSVEVRRWWQGVRLLPRIKTGRLSDSDYVRTMRGDKFEVCTKRPRSINTDGEITGKTPAVFRVVPSALSVFVPDSSGPSADAQAQQT